MVHISYNQRGVSIIAAIFIIVILAFMGVMFLSLINTSSVTAVDNLQSTQALQVAQGGIEYILNFGTFPNFSMGGVSKNLGAGQFLTSTPAYLTAAVNFGNTTISVNSTAGFYPGSVAVPGWIIIDADTISYTGSTGNSFTGVTSITAAHAIGNAVYPVASLTTALANNCTSPVTIHSSYASNNFLMPGIVTIGTEMFYCTGDTIGPPGSFNNCTRCYQGTVSATHAVATGNIFQYVVTSTGTVGNARRTIQAGLSNNANAAVRYDNRSPGTGFTGQQILTWNQTVTTTRANTMLIVGVSLYDMATPTVTGVTYNGVPLSSLNARNGLNGSYVRVEQWGLVSPPGGANLPIVVNLSGPANLAVGGSISLYNVNQANPLDVSPVDGAGNSPSNSPSLTITTATSNDMVVDTLAASESGNITSTIGNGQTSRWNIIFANGPMDLRGAGSYKAAGAGAAPVNVTMYWTLSASNWAYSVLAVRPQGLALVYWRELIN
jgi:hypothetical protein